jgi:Bacteriophage tail sheath protein
VPVHPTYPGVYVEEIPSAVRTIVGVSTSVTAFIGYTAKGPTNHPLQLFSFGDYERAFGGLDLDSPVSYAVGQFFQNGGLEAWVVRTASGSGAASVGLRNGNGAGAGVQLVLTATAKSDGLWGNGLQLTVDFATTNAKDLFNLTVTELREQNGALVVGATEVHRNLSMNDQSPSYAVDAVKANSLLIDLATPAGLTTTADATARSGLIDPAVFDVTLLDADHRRVAVSIDNKAPFEIELAAPTGTGATALTNIAADVVAKVNAAAGVTITGSTVAVGTKRQLVFTNDVARRGRHSSLRFMNASTRSAAALLALGLANGGIEQDGSASLRPSPSGTVGDDISALDLTTFGAAPAIKVTLDYPTGSDVVLDGLELWASAAGDPTSPEDLRSRIEAALRNVALTRADVADELAAARVQLVDGGLQLLASGQAGVRLIVADSVTPADTTATALLKLNGATKANVARYQLGVGPTVVGQTGALPGSDGTLPGPSDIMGSEAGKTGIFALADVDLFNLMCIPARSENDVLAAAMTYCETRRAFLIADVPSTTDTLVEAQAWITAAATPKSKNAAAYFPWVILPDPLQDYRPRPFPPSGMVAGLYARTDGTRGVWKAPAGTEATLRGPQGVTYKLSDPENGTLNPLGLNAIRALPVYGIVAWGARTLVGSDQAASEWKYTPVRRLALYIEESLFRGSQWVVFEPNDEPLWSQIRLNVGAFMQSLFRQGAFQGASPREAYLVKCDHETTTQNDINLGIVNILVGFAPLKPAEFVILKITQLAGQVEA